MLPPRQQHRRQRRVDGAPPPVGDRAGKRGRRDVARHRGDRDRRRDADEDQQRRHQEAAADAEHAGDEADRRAHREDQEDIDRNVGDREIKLHARSLFVMAAEAAGAAHGEVSSSICRQGNPPNARAGSEHGPVAASLHNRIRRQAGLKNCADGNFLPRPIAALAVQAVTSTDRRALAARPSGGCGDEVHRGRLPRIQPADIARSPTSPPRARTRRPSASDS